MQAGRASRRWSVLRRGARSPETRRPSPSTVPLRERPERLRGGHAAVLHYQVFLRCDHRVARQRHGPDHLLLVSLESGALVGVIGVETQEHEIGAEVLGHHGRRKGVCLHLPAVGAGVATEVHKDGLPSLFSLGHCRVDVVLVPVQVVDGSRPGATAHGEPSHIGSVTWGERTRRDCPAGRRGAPASRRAPGSGTRRLPECAPPHAPWCLRRRVVRKPRSAQ